MCVCVRVCVRACRVCRAVHARMHFMQCAYMCAVGHIAMHRLFYSTAMKPYKYAGYPMLIKTIELGDKR